MVGGEAAHLGDRLGGALKEFRPVVHGPAGAVGAAGFLVGEEGEDDVALGLAARRGRSRAARRGSWRPCPSCPRRRGPRSGRPCSSPPNGSTRPLLLQRRDDVQVAVHHQRAPADGSSPAIRVDDAGAARGGLEDFGVQPHLFDQPGRVLGGRALPGALIRRRSWRCRCGSVPGRSGRLRLRAWTVVHWFSSFVVVRLNRWPQPTQRRPDSFVSVRSRVMSLSRCFCENNTSERRNGRSKSPPARVAEWQTR